MTRKDYPMLSAALLRATPSAPGDPNNEFMRIAFAASKSQHAAVCRFVADALAQDNRAFDRERFLRDAGVQS